jgi:hypothetical protein
MRLSHKGDGLGFHARSALLTGPRLHWEQVSLRLWICDIGYIKQERGVWAAFVYRNMRTGESWIDHQAGFGSADDAKRWVEERAEE